MIDMVVFYIKIEMETKYKKIIDLFPFRNILFAYSKPATDQRCRTNLSATAPFRKNIIPLLYSFHRYLLIA